VNMDERHNVVYATWARDNPSVPIYEYYSFDSLSEYRRWADQMEMLKYMSSQIHQNFPEHVPTDPAYVRALDKWLQ